MKEFVEGSDDEITKEVKAVSQFPLDRCAVEHDEAAVANGGNEAAVANGGNEAADGDELKEINENEAPKAIVNFEAVSVTDVHDEGNSVLEVNNVTTQEDGKKMFIEKMVLVFLPVKSWRIWQTLRKLLMPLKTLMIQLPNFHSILVLQYLI